MTVAKITLRHLIFTGTGDAKVGVTFDDGLNVIYGASNTGKSFATKAIAFMLAANSALPKIEELAGYDAAWLGLVLPDGREVTLYRSTLGGALRLYSGLVSGADPSQGKKLLGRFDAKKYSNVSHFLLDTVGLSKKVIVRDANAKKDALSIRLLLPYVIVSESSIVSEASPVLYSSIPSQRTFERNLFKLLLTGVDDASAVTVSPPATQQVAISAKVELVDELIAQLDQDIGPDAMDRSGLLEQRQRLDSSLASLHDDLRLAQSELDAHVTQRRQLADTQQDIVARAAELDVTLERFGRLSAVYESDVARLMALEEGGFILVSMAGRDCPVCGAAPGAQRHNHAAEEIALAHRAAHAEIAKIQVEQRELKLTMRSLEAEAAGLRARLISLATQIETLDERITALRPRESESRQRYEALAATRSKLAALEETYERRDRLLLRRSQIENPERHATGETRSIGVDDIAAYEFGEIVKEVLVEWRFPQAERAQFDIVINDVTIGGKPRAANGKGVRAILHAAFNVAVLIHCRRKRLPHPGFLILDTPLLTFRGPLSRHGALSDDEAALRQTGLATYFYRHLASLKEWAQIIVIENADPPDAIRNQAHINTFTKTSGSGRYGLFPPRGDQEDATAHAE